VLASEVCKPGTCLSLSCAGPVPRSLRLKKKLGFREHVPWDGAAAATAEADAVAVDVVDAVVVAEEVAAATPAVTLPTACMTVVAAAVALVVVPDALAAACATVMTVDGVHRHCMATHTQQ
jgi:hypothetical protein